MRAHASVFIALCSCAAMFVLALSGGVASATDTTSAYATAVLGDAPAGYWPLDDPWQSTTATDATGNGWVGTYSSDVELGGDGPIDSNNDTAAAFDDSGAVGISPAPQTGLASTIEFWVSSAQATAGTVILLTNGCGLTASVGLNSTGQIDAQLVAGGTETETTSSEAINDGNWHEVDVVFPSADNNDGPATLYVDGAAVTTTMSSQSNDTCYGKIAPLLSIGSGVDGSVGQVAYYESALSAEQVVAHYAAATSDGSDQTAATGDETTSSPTSPVPMSPSGPAESGTYTTELWSADETATTDGVNVISSEASGTFALTGTVVDSSSNAGVTSATVTAACSACSPSSVSTTTDSQGTYAFIDLPPGIYSLTVAASGYGSYELENNEFDADQEYVQTAALGPDVQTFDESIQPQDVAQEMSPDPGGGYASYRRVPPSIRVAMVPQTSTCGQASPYEQGTTPVRTYSWRDYMLHVTASEIYSYFTEPAVKAFMAAAQNYAWYHKRIGGAFDVDDTTNYQCFHPEKPVPRKWKVWIDDVLAHRIAKSNGTLQETPYRAGNAVCSDPNFPENGNVGSQLGMQALSENCGYTDWHAIDQYYYTGRVVNGTIPNLPTTSFSSGSGNVMLTFKAAVGGDNVAWSYEAERLTGSGWHLIYNRGWSPSSRSVPTSFTYSTSTCQQYRVRAVNPVGSSKYVAFNKGTNICPN